MTPAKRLEDRIAALPAFLRAQQPRPRPAPNAPAMPQPLVDRPTTRAQWIEVGILVVCIMVIAGAFVTAIHPELGDRPANDEPAPEDGYPDLRLLALPPYLAITVLILGNLRNFTRVVRQNVVHLILPAIVVMSLAWTNDPTVTSRRVLAFLIPTSFALYLASRYTERGMVRVLFASFVGCMGLSAAFVVLMPSVGIMQFDAPGLWRGAFTHKNVLGPVVLHAGLFAVAAWIQGIIKTRGLVATTLAACVMVVGSRSVTSLVGFLALVYALPLFLIGKVDRRALAVYLCVSLAMLAALVPFVSDVGAIMEAFGRDASLTGRLPLWGYVLAFASDRFLLGYGYGAFWAVGDSPGTVIRGLVGWSPPHAHNALLQALGDVGLVGASALVLSMAVTLTHAGRRAARATIGADVFPALALWILLVLSVSEARLLEPNSIDWLMYVSVAAGMARPRPVQLAPELVAARTRP